ncbi:MAG: TerB family tellurite resistance protein [Bacteroidia bacterium]|nr:TerB family tellurite resistance protein [Bacteroidia bacterium]
MKKNTDERIKNAQGVSKETLIEKIKTTDPTRFDQMLIESEERKNYFYVKYKALAYTREPKTLKFPLFKDWVNDFENTIEQSGEPEILQDDRIIQKVIAKGYSPTDTRKYSGKNLVFSELKLVLDGDKVKAKQPFYYLPNETERCTCDTCNGDKYVECPETECRGQHIYECKDCRGQGETDCPTCKGTGRLKCKGYVGRGTGGGMSNAVYSCQNGRCKCDSCTGNGYDNNGNRCRNRCDRGWITCPTCKGAGDVPCELKYASSYGVGKLFDAATGKTFCKGKGTITCEKCEGKGEIECKTCYGDHKDNRYGKVDCKTCETAGELASISYIETEIKSYNLDLVFTDGKKIDTPNFGVETIKKFANANGQLVLTYKNLNGESKENYDEHSTFCSKNALVEVGDYKDRYPKLISEEIYYESVPCATYNYNHILSATFHDVSVLSVDKQQEVLFHSNPADVAEEKESFKDKANELLRKAFSTKAFKDKIDRKHEMFLMVHMAKADGIIEEQEKRYLSQTITGLHGFTQKEKAELFGLMSATTLPAISPTNAYFSSKERAEEARKKIIELVAKADGEYEPQEKAKLEEINNAIELGYKAKPSALGRFFKTWQVSVSLFLLLCLVAVGIYFGTVVYPQLKAEREAKRQAEMERQQAEIDSLLNASEQTKEVETAQQETVVNKEEEETEDTILTDDVNESVVNDEVSSNAEIVYYKVQDPDGYSNLRDKPNGEVIRKVYDNETFEIIGKEGKFQKVKLSDGTEGFIHESRVVKADL